MADQDDKKMAVSEWEKECGLLLSTDEDSILNKSLTKSAFLKLADDKGFKGCDFDGREKWLADNGHDVSRHNMRDVNLQAREKS